MEFVISYDLRAPAFGTPAREIYAATLDQCEWADALGFDAVGLGEHHASEDGYLPSPIPMAGAIGGRTKRILVRPNVLLAPLYEPVKLAEDLAVLQYICDGRLEVVIGAGYVPYEFQMFGKRREDRKALYVNAFEVLKKAWSGETFDYEGRSVTVRPVPDPPPRLLLGGTHKAVAKRAAKIADGFYPPAGENWDVYREACLELGKPDPGASFKALGPIYTHVTEDPDGDWAKIAPHAKHVVESYAKWTVEAYGRAAGPFAGGVDIDDLKASGSYLCLRPEEAVEMIEGLGRDRTFILTPLLGGLDPELSWSGLRLFEDRVWPHVKHLQDGTNRGD
ncbi:MAG: LLM class flavin-dependent oxidoreductase [bacterium]|nr:LLM class flavin-dependent oxidoreductase [bacterium]